MLVLVVAKKPDITEVHFIYVVKDFLAASCVAGAELVSVGEL